MPQFIDNKFDIGQEVYLKTDPDQLKRIIDRFIIYRAEILYGCACGTQSSEHYDFELSLRKNVLADV